MFIASGRFNPGHQILVDRLKEIKPLGEGYNFSGFAFCDLLVNVMP